MSEFKVICIDDTSRPNEIPTSKWIKKDETYTVIKAEHMNVQNRLVGFELAEIDINDCFPYTRFSSNRFRPVSEDDIKAEEAVKELLKVEILNY
jgi:hypothetical protein